MNKIIAIFLIGSISLCSLSYNGSTTAAVTLAGAIIKTQHSLNHKKYKRKDCPVCKGKGWYISGDGIEKVPCGYCEIDNGEKSVTHPPIIIRGCDTQIFRK